MNTIVNLNRLGLLLKRYFIENKQSELSFWAIATVVFTLSHNSFLPVSMFIYIAGMVFAAKTFKIFSHTPGGMHYLLIPATHTEKLLTAIIISTFYYFAMFMITYMVGTFVGINASNFIFGINYPIVFDLFQPAERGMSLLPDIREALNLLSLFTSFASIQAVFMLGSLYFKRNAVGKTLLVIIALWLSIVIIEFSFIRSILPNDMSSSMNSINFNLANVNTEFIDTFKTFGTILSYLAIPFFWTVSYFRLTEKEV